MQNSGGERNHERGAGEFSGVLALAGASAVAVVAFGFLGYTLQGSDDESPQPVTHLVETPVSARAFEAAEIGEQKEDVLASLMPAEPVDARVVARYQERSPETVASSCVYYRTPEDSAEELFRFCFVQDRLVDKTVVLPSDAPAAG